MDNDIKCVVCEKAKPSIYGVANLFSQNDFGINTVAKCIEEKVDAITVGMVKVALKKIMEVECNGISEDNDKISFLISDDIQILQAWASTGDRHKIILSNAARPEFKDYNIVKLLQVCVYAEQFLVYKMVLNFIKKIVEEENSDASCSEKTEVDSIGEPEQPPSE